MKKFFENYKISNFQFLALKHYFRCTSNEESARQTLEVFRRIKDKKDAALLGGGVKRIDSQHKKVNYLIICKKYSKL